MVERRRYGVRQISFRLANFYQVRMVIYTVPIPLSSCVYGRKLSAIVYSETTSLLDESFDDDVEVEVTTLGHNAGKAQIVSVRCH